MAFYRKAVWFYKGWKDYTQDGYLDAEKKFDPGDLDGDLKGKSFMITGNLKYFFNQGIPGDVQVYLHIIFGLL